MSSRADSPVDSLVRRIESAAHRDDTRGVTFVVGGTEEIVPWRDLHRDAQGYAAGFRAVKHDWISAK